MAVTGLKQIIKNMSSFDRKTVRRLVIAVQATQVTVINDAQAIVPKVTRNLMQSLNPPGRVLITDKLIEGEASAKMDYASFVELGTSRQRPQPYLAPSLIKNGSSFHRLAQRAISV